MFWASPDYTGVHGILQATILKWVAIPFSRGCSWPRDRTQVFCISGRFFIYGLSHQGTQTGLNKPQYILFRLIVETAGLFQHKSLEAKVTMIIFVSLLE